MVEALDELAAAGVTTPTVRELDRLLVAHAVVMWGIALRRWA